MSLHDAYARTTPFEMAFPDADAAETLFARIAQGAQARGLDARDPLQFRMVDAVGAHVQALRGPDAPAQAVMEYTHLIYQAFHFAGAGAPLCLLSTPATRYLVEGAPAGGAPEAPGGAGYVQLPQHLFWSEAGPEGAPQSVDGLFWTLGAREELHVMLVMGVQAGEGLMVVPLSPAPWAHRDEWLDTGMRSDGTDYASALPGAEIDGLYSFESAGEVLKLLARLFAYQAEFPGTPAEPSQAEGPPAPSRLPYTRVELHG